MANYIEICSLNRLCKFLQKRKEKCRLSRRSDGRAGDGRKKAPQTGRAYSAGQIMYAAAHLFNSRRGIPCGGKVRGGASDLGIFGHLGILAVGVMGADLGLMFRVLPKDGGIDLGVKGLAQFVDLLGRHVPGLVGMAVAPGSAGGFGVILPGEHAGQHVAALRDAGPEIAAFILGPAGAKQFMVHKMPSPFANSRTCLRPHWMMWQLFQVVTSSIGTKGWFLCVRAGDFFGKACF